MSATSKRQRRKVTPGPIWRSNAFVASIRHYIGAYLVLLGGADAIVFTGGIGENSRRVRSGVCRDMEWAGLRLDAESQ